MTNEQTRTLHFDDPRLMQTVLGVGNAHTRILERGTGASIGSRGDQVVLRGHAHEVELAQDCLEQLYGLARAGYALYPSDVEQGLRILARDGSAKLADIFMDTILVSARKRTIAPRGPAQKAYIDAIRRQDIVFGVGPAGTGKTYLAMAMAVAALNSHDIKRIILTRPAVEAGEKLGFLPGDLAEKVNPYLRPLYDALNEMMEMDKVQRFLSQGIIEVAPLAFMRGRTLNDAFVVLDEAQNTTSEQMKMFLTRLGFNSKAVITGDITQVDLPVGRPSGLIEARRILEGVEGISFCHFTDADVVRHPLVMKIIRAYEREDQRRAAAKAEAEAAEVEAEGEETMAENGE